jgi:hypothetical protein
MIMLCDPRYQQLLPVRASRRVRVYVLGANSGAKRHEILQRASADRTASTSTHIFVAAEIS